MSFNTFSKEIINLISANISGIQDVANYEKQPFAGYPACTVTESDNESDYETTAENRRVYAFRIRIYEQTGRALGTVDNSAAERSSRVVRELVDSFLDTFDQNYTLGSNALMVEAAPSNWGWETRENNILRFAEIVLRIHKIVDVT